MIHVILSLSRTTSSSGTLPLGVQRGRPLKADGITAESHSHWSTHLFRSHRVPLSAAIQYCTCAHSCLIAARAMVHVPSVVAIDKRECNSVTSTGGTIPFSSTTTLHLTHLIPHQLPQQATEHLLFNGELKTTTPRHICLATTSILSAPVRNTLNTVQIFKPSLVLRKKILVLVPLPFHFPHLTSLSSDLTSHRLLLCSFLSPLTSHPLRSRLLALTSFLISPQSSHLLSPLVGSNSRTDGSKLARRSV
jgi:hypothetical protein